MTEVKIPVAENILVSLNMGAEELVSAMREEFALKSFRDGKNYPCPERRFLRS
jgi:hypothetical protein